MPPHYSTLTGSSAKINKSRDIEIETAILYLAPDPEICPASTPACRAACLYHAGHAQMFPAIKERRQARTARFRQLPWTFTEELIEDVRKLATYAKKKGRMAALRLNGTSDVAPQEFSHVYQAAVDYNVITYEYTKRRDCARLEEHTTYSLADPARDNIVQGQANAVVFDLPQWGRAAAKPLPETYRGYRVIDGDESDARFLDRQLFGLDADETYIVGLRMKRVGVVRAQVARDYGFSV